MSGSPVILLVEDEPLIREVIAAELDDAGYRVVEAGTGEEAVGVLAAADEIALLLTDIRLPGALDGWGVAAEARRLRPGLPVIYATGHSQTGPFPVEGSRLFHKPFRTYDLLDAIRGFGIRPAAG